MMEYTLSRIQACLWPWASAGTRPLTGCWKGEAAVVLEQGDRMSRVTRAAVPHCCSRFAQWVVVYFLQFHENDRSGPDFLFAYFQGKDYAIILTRRVLGYILGDFCHMFICSPWGWAWEKTTSLYFSTLKITNRSYIGVRELWPLA
jgi:hypothetical protein